MMLAVISTPQKLGVVIAAVLIVGWLGYLLAHLAKAGPAPGSEIELAPNRKPYFDDDALETKKLDASLGVALLLLVVSAVGLPAYWVREAGRENGAVKMFQKDSIARGTNLFLPTDSPKLGAHFGCATCHGADGSGGVAKYTITDYLGRTVSVQWKAPALNTVGYRFSNAAIRQILVYGRAGTPMPAWGTKGGGPMNDQQIDDLVNYLTTPKAQGGLRLPKDDAMKATRDLAVAEAKKEGKEAVDGQVLFNTNCARCHTRGWSYDQPEISGGGRYGPNLTNGDTVRQFPDEADMIKFITQGVEYGQPYGIGGIGQDAGGGMPHFGDLLSEDDIKAIVEYERSL